MIPNVDICYILGGGGGGQKYAPIDSIIIMRDDIMLAFHNDIP